MFSNSIKLTFASMYRRKWQSALSLLSIAFALVMVTCAASVWNSWTAPIAPEVNKDRTFFLDGKAFPKVDGGKVYYRDIIRNTPSRFFQDGVYQLKTPALVSVFNYYNRFCLMRNNKSKWFESKLTDHNFFKLFDFEFVNGKAYVEANNQAYIPHCVISEKLAIFYFGNADCLGKIVKDPVNSYKVCGVIKAVVTLDELQGDLY